MGLILDEYKLTKWVDEKIKAYEAVHPEIPEKGDTYTLKFIKLATDYSKASDKSVSEARDLIRSCLRDNYLAELMHANELSVYVHPSGGRRILRHVFFKKIPSGFVKEVIKDNNQILTFIIGILLGLIPLLLYWLNTSASQT